MKPYKVFLGIFFAMSFLLFSGQKLGVAAADRAFEVISLKKSTPEGYLVLEAKYVCNLQEAQDIKIKFYVELEKDKEKTLAVGEKITADVKKGRYKESATISAKDIKTYGKEEKYRVEVWHQNKLMAAQTKPSSSIQEKWWNAEKTVSIIDTALDIKELIKKLDD